MSTYNIVTDVIGKIVSGDVINCPYSGSFKSIALPNGIYVIEVWGAQGGYRSSSTYGGKGGYSKGKLTTGAPTVAYLYAGGSGNSASASGSSSVLTQGGYNGGGARHRYCGGGGASDVRLLADTLNNRVIVAGGGGSDGASGKAGGYGGGATGESRTDNYGIGGGGGTQTAGGAGGSGNSGTFGAGGNGLYRSSGYGGAGGGGWYGGGGAYPDSSGDDDRGGGGGSGFVWTGSNAPSGYALGGAHYLSETVLSAGNVSLTQPDGTTAIGVSGNGYVRITVIEAGVKAPRGLVQTGKDYRSISISWSPETNISTYKVYRDGVSIAITTTTSYVDVNLYPSEKHAYTVSCMDGSDESLQSEPILAETLEAYYAKTIDVKSVEIVPQSVAVRQNIKISVEIKEGIQILYPTKYYCGMTVSGFEPLPQ